MKLRSVDLHLLPVLEAEMEGAKALTSEQRTRRTMKIVTKKSPTQNPIPWNRGHNVSQEKYEI